MTQMLSRSVLSGRESSLGPQRPLVLSAVAAALWVVFVGLVSCVAVSVAAWVAADSGSFGGAIRVGALAWLVTLGSGLNLDGVSITAVPLGLTAVTAWLLYRGGRWAGASSAPHEGRQAAWAVVVIGGTFTATVLVVLVATSSPDVHAEPLRALVASASLAGIFGGWGLVRGAKLSEQLLGRLSTVARAILSGGCAGVAALVMLSGCLFTAAVIARFSAALGVAEKMHGSVVGGAIVALVGIAMVPNAVLCAGSFLVGPGFSVGAGTSVAPSGVTLGTLPTFPLFAAVPTDDGGWWQQLLIWLPVLAGAVAGLITLRRLPVDHLSRAALRGACAGLVTGAGFGALTWLATGAIGPGRMQEVGPNVAMTMLVASGAAVLGGAAAATTARWRAGEPPSSRPLTRS